jgi:hypothetical protein
MTCQGVSYGESGNASDRPAIFMQGVQLEVSSRSAAEPACDLVSYSVILASRLGLRGPGFAIPGSAGAHELHRESRVCRGSGPSVNQEKGGSTMAGGNDLAETALDVRGIRAVED